MATRSTHWAILLASGIVAAFLLGYYYWDRASLLADTQPLVSRTLTEFEGRYGSRQPMETSASVTVWREIPFVGKPAAKVTVVCGFHTPSGRVVSQTLDYFFRRDGAVWVEMMSGGSMGHDHGEKHGDRDATAHGHH